MNIIVSRGVVVHAWLEGSLVHISIGKCCALERIDARSFSLNADIS
jgi:hypothetical protein